ncbi:MAG: tetratricopeptide repeat protein [Nitrospira sp.]|nr:tetratricopeptide repeat protein [Nitrospira sp.]MBH0180926.1 tetratricopeptide repeat protein [Nitrospira sp.]
MTSLPFTRWHYRVGGSVVVLSLCLLSACTLPTSRFPSTPPPHRVLHNNPAYDAQVRLLQEAHRAFAQERYPAAALFFNRFIDDATESPRLAEARWWLGRAYEQLGDYRSALAQYRLLAAESIAQQADGPLYEGYALRRLDELRRPRIDRHYGDTTQVALHMTVDQLPPITGLVPWLRELAQAGVTVLAIAPAHAPKSGHQEFTVETMQSVAAEAHRLGLLVWVVLEIHDGHGLDIRPEWMVATGYTARPDASRSKVDILHPGYQSYLEDVIGRLVRAGCDGVLLAARSSPGFATGFTDDSRRLFAASFRLSGTLEDIVGGTVSSDIKEEGRSANYWRWIGWKARNYAQWTVRLRKVLRERNPAATLMIEVHRSSLITPLHGLEQFGEDVAELTPDTGGSLVVRDEGVVGDAALEKIGRQLGGADRVWIGLPVRVATIPVVVEELNRSIANLAERRRWNMVIRVESMQAVP